MDFLNVKKCECPAGEKLDGSIYKIFDLLLALFEGILADQGVVNQLLLALGIIQEPIQITYQCVHAGGSMTTCTCLVHGAALRQFGKMISAC